MLDELYQQVILDHNRAPRHYGPLPSANRRADGVNPLCGDRLSVALELDGDRISDIRFEGSGCAISRASSSLMTDAVVGRSIADALALFDRFRAVITAPADAPVDPIALDAIGKLAVLAGVREFPARVKCASLPWHTLKAALAGAACASSE